MAERVFPHNTGVDMGSKIQFSGIDWAKVESNMKNQRFAQDHSDDIIEMIAKLTGTSPEQIEEVVDQFRQETGSEMGSEMGSEIGSEMDSEIGSEMGSEMGSESPMKSVHISLEDKEPKMELPNHDESPLFAKKSVDGDVDKVLSDEDEDEDFSGDVKKDLSDEDEDEDEDEDDSEEESDEESLSHAGYGNPKTEEDSFKFSSSNKMKKIAFTNIKQISAEAIESAMKQGDMKMVNTILSARKENRIRIAKIIKDNMEKTASQKNTQVKKAKVADKPIVSDKFTAPKDFTNSQRLAFNQAAREAGLPEAYVKSMTPIDQSVEILNSKIKEVYSSSLSQTVKNTVVKTLIKEAKLSPDSKSEFVDYWNNVLGYQDKEFWPAVAADYSDGKKVK